VELRGFEPLVLPAKMMLDVHRWQSGVVTRVLVVLRVYPAVLRHVTVLGASRRRRRGHAAVKGFIENSLAVRGRCHRDHRSGTSPPGARNTGAQPSTSSHALARRVALGGARTSFQTDAAESVLPAFAVRAVTFMPWTWGEIRLSCSNRDATPNY
jgi:hypothetical protein